MPISPYRSLEEIASPAERSDFEAFRLSSTPTAEQLARFNRPEFGELLAGNYVNPRAEIQVLPPEAAEIIEWYGDLRTAPEANISLPALKSVGGEVEIKGGAKFEAPALVSVGRSVSVFYGAKFEAPALVSVGRSVDVYDGAKLEVPALASVSATVIVREGAKFEAPALAYSGAVYVDKEAKFEAPALATVGDELELMYPALAEIEVVITVHEGATFNAPLLGYGVEAKPEPAQRPRPPLPTPVIPTPKVGGTDGHAF